MGVSTILDNAQTMITEIASNNPMDIVKTQDMMIFLVVSGVIGLLWCFFGLKLVRVWAAVLGFVLGSAIGGAAAWQFGLDTNVILIIALIAGIILACLGAVLYRVGIFVVVWIAGCSAAAQMLQPKEIWLMLVCAGIGLVAALLTVKFAEIITIVVTGVVGAMAAGPSISDLAGLDMHIIRLLITVGIAALGILVQFLLESGKRKKKHLKKAAEIRDMNSTANEVEKARAVFEDSGAEDAEDTAENRNRTDVPNLKDEEVIEPDEFEDDDEIEIIELDD